MTNISVTVTSFNHYESRTEFCYLTDFNCQTQGCNQPPLITL